jgi:ankyrin repeat protein
MHLLLEKKADPNLKDHDGSAPLLAAATGRVDAATLLPDSGADVNLADASGNTALIAADGNPDANADKQMISVLLEHKARLDPLDRSGRTALARATESNNTAAIPDAHSTLSNPASAVPAVSGGFPRNLSAPLARLQESDRNRLLPARDLAAFATLTAEERPPLFPVQRAFYALARGLSVLAT